MPLGGGSSQRHFIFVYDMSSVHRKRIRKVDNRCKTVMIAPCSGYVWSLPPSWAFPLSASFSANLARKAFAGGVCRPLDTEQDGRHRHALMPLTAMAETDHPSHTKTPDSLNEIRCQILVRDLVTNLPARSPAHEPD
jgi:hypothetical protein